MTALTALTLWEHIKCVLQKHSHLPTESGRKSATTILCYRAATAKQSNSPGWKSFFFSFFYRVKGEHAGACPSCKQACCMAGYSPGWVQSRLQGPIWAFGGSVSCSRVLAAARCPTSTALSREPLPSQPSTPQTEQPSILVLFHQQFKHHFSNINFNEGSSVLNWIFCCLSLS